MKEILEYCKRNGCSIKFGFDIPMQVKITVIETETSKRFENCLPWDHIIDETQIFNCVQYCVKALNDHHIIKPTIYTPPVAKYQLRVNIKQSGGIKTEHLSIVGVTQDELHDYLKKLIDKQNLSLFSKGFYTNVEIRESVPYVSDGLRGTGLNGKAVSFRFKGLSPKQVKELIIKDLQ